VRRLAALTAAVLVLSGSSVVLAQSAAAAGTGETFVSLPSARIVDTRTGVGAPKRAVAAHQLLSPTVAGTGHVVPSTATAVQVTITTPAPTASGGITAYGPAPRPGTTNVQFITGHGESGSALVQLAAGRINLYNAAARGTVQVVVDLTGYWAPTAASTGPGVLHPVAPRRIIDTRYGTGGVAKKAIAGHQAVTAAVAGTGKPVPSGTGAVAVTITAVGPATAGGLIVYAGGATPPTEVTQYFTAQRGVSTFAVVPLSSAGTMSVYNSSGGTVNVVVDLAGYYVAGVPLDAGALRTLTPKRALDRSGVPSAGTVSVHVGGVGGVPRAGKTVAIVTVSVIAPVGGGGVTAWTAGQKRPGVTTVQYLTGQNVSATALVPISSSGDISLYNASSGAERLLVDIDGYLPAIAVTPPSGGSTARYVRNIDGGAGDATTMQDEGASDAAAGYTYVLLDIGAQSNDGSGVQLTLTSRNLAYGQLVAALKAYVTGYSSGSGGLVAVGTNNEAQNWTTYTGTKRGADWATEVIDPLRSSAPSSIKVVGADDIEPGFGTQKESDAQEWETAYLNATKAPLIFNGSADACPSTFGTTGTCAHGWTQRQLYSLAHSGTRITVLPQIYFPEQAAQWAGIEAAGDPAGTAPLSFDGSLTESVDTPDSPSQGWAGLYRALSTLVTTPTLPRAVDIHVDA
jgi:hypothetical protein